MIRLSFSPSVCCLRPSMRPVGYLLALVLIAVAHSSLGSLDLGDQAALKDIAAQWTVLQIGSNAWSASDASLACTVPWWRGVVCSAVGPDRVVGLYVFLLVFLACFCDYFLAMAHF